MEFKSTLSKDFLDSAIRLLRENKEMLALVRYPNRCGARDYILFVDENNFLDFVKKLEAGDSLTIFKITQTLWRGNPTKETIPSIINILEKYNNQWLLSIEASSYPPYFEGKSKWALTETLKELKEELIGDFKHNTTILLEPDFCNEAIILHAYGPNKFGIGQPKGAY